MVTLRSTNTTGNFIKTHFDTKEGLYMLQKIFEFFNRQTRIGDDFPEKPFAYINTGMNGYGYGYWLSHL